VQGQTVHKSWSASSAFFDKNDRKSSVFIDEKDPAVKAGESRKASIFIQLICMN